MADSKVTIRGVSWDELFPWLMLVRSVRIALLARVLVLGAVGLIATTLGWRVIGWVFSTSDDAVIQAFRHKASQWAWEESRELTIALSARSADEIFHSAQSGLLEAPVALWMYLTRPFIDLFSADVSPMAFLYLLMCVVWELVVWGVFGGAITRVAALKFTRDEAPGMVAMVKHAVSKLPSYGLPPLLALAGAALFAGQLVVVGVFMRIGVFALVAALAWPFVLMLGLLMAILLLGALIGWPLMWATIGVEGTDAFDAISRSYAYTYQRPWRLLWYVSFVAVLAVVSMFVVRVFTSTAIALGDWSIDWGIDEATMQTVVRPRSQPVDEVLAPPLAPAAEITAAGGTEATSLDSEAADKPGEGPQDLGIMMEWARAAIFFWKSLMAALAAGYQAGFLWVSAVGVYLLLRRDIDGVQTTEVYVEQEEQFGLPALDGDATTEVPAPAPSAAAQPGHVLAANQPPSAL